MSLNSTSFEKILQVADGDDDKLLSLVTERHQELGSVGRHRSPEADLHNMDNTNSDSSFEISQVPHMSDSNDSGGRDDRMVNQQPYEPRRQSERTCRQHQHQNYMNQLHSGQYDQNTQLVDTLQEIYSPYSQKQLDCKLSPSSTHQNHQIHPGIPAQEHRHQTPQIVKSGKRIQVKNACTNCQKACKKCDDNRPCARCTKYNMADSCVNSTRKERVKGLKRGPYRRREEEFHDMTNILSLQRPHTHSHSEYPSISHRTMSTNALLFHQKFANTEERMLQSSTSISSSSTIPCRSNIIIQSSSPTNNENFRLPSLSELQVSLQRPINKEQQSVALHTNQLNGTKQPSTLNIGENSQNSCHVYHNSNPSTMSHIQEPLKLYHHSPPNSNIDSQPSRVASQNSGLIDAHLEYLANSKPFSRSTAPLSTPSSMISISCMQHPSTSEYYKLGLDTHHSHQFGWRFSPAIGTMMVGNYDRTHNIPSGTTTSLYSPIPDRTVHLNAPRTVVLPPLKMLQAQQDSIQNLSKATSQEQIEMTRKSLTCRLDELSDLCSVIGT